MASGSPVVLGTARSSPRRGFGAPTQGRLAVSGREGEMVVSWTSGAGADQPRVRWAAEPGVCSSPTGHAQKKGAGVALGHSTTYTAGEMCGGRAAQVSSGGKRRRGACAGFFLLGLRYVS